MKVTSFDKALEGISLSFAWTEVKKKTNKQMYFSSSVELFEPPTAYYYEYTSTFVSHPETPSSE
jgi:hypothetical protein